MATHGAFEDSLRSPRSSPKTKTEITIITLPAFLPVKAVRLLTLWPAAFACAKDLAEASPGYSRGRFILELRKSAQSWGPQGTLEGGTIVRGGS